MINEVEALKIQLKSATKMKLTAERNACLARNRERSLNDLLATVKAEIDFAKEKMEDMKIQISQTRHHISLIEICTASEKSKIDAHVSDLNQHMKGFQQLFDKERVLFDLRTKEIQDKEAEEQEMQRQREREIAKKNEQEAKEAALVQAECDALEQECTVLKKRNNAMLLTLKRKLLETDKARRELAKKNAN